MVLPGKVIEMKCFLSPILRPLAGLTVLLGTRGIRAVLAENFLLKQQLLVMRRSRWRAPNLRTAQYFAPFSGDTREFRQRVSERVPGQEVSPHARIPHASRLAAGTQSASPFNCAR